jgi:uncharacterized membrane protein
MTDPPATPPTANAAAGDRPGSGSRGSPVRLALLPARDLAATAALAAAGWLLLRYAGDHPAKAVAEFLKDRRGTLYGAALSVHAGLLGFVLATTTVVLGYAQSTRFEVLRDSRHYRALYRAFTASIGMFALATVTTFTALLLDRDTAPHRLAFVLAAAVSIVAAIRLARVLHLLRLAIDIVLTSRAREPGQ